MEYLKETYKSRNDIMKAACKESIKSKEQKI